jgi:hypothetical protein
VAVDRRGAYWLIVAALAGTAACKQAETRCPADTQLVGGKPPDATEEWCEYRDAAGKSVKHGSYVAWYKDSHKQAEVLYRDGKEDGPTTVWYPNGRKMLEGSYRDGQRDGVWERWYESGKKELETEFSVGKKDGRDRRWDEQGTLVADLDWKDGKVVGSRVGPPAGSSDQGGSTQNP